MNTPKNLSYIKHPGIRKALNPVARRVLETQRLRIRFKALTYALGTAGLCAGLGLLFPALGEFSLLLALAAVVGFSIHAYQQEKNTRLDYLTAAKTIEHENPDLKLSLVTAVEQHLEYKDNFFAQHLTQQTLESSLHAQWQKAGSSSFRKELTKTLGIVCSLVGILYLCYVIPELGLKGIARSTPDQIADASLFVEPRDIEVENGSSVVITARFEGTLPQDVQIELLDDLGALQNLDMAQSLSDPVFAYSLRGIESPLRYRVRYGDQFSDYFRISTYELPDLEQADAHLRFPEYTERENRVIEDTLRVSAIEGTQLDYRFKMNKPLLEAFLEDESGKRIELAASDTNRLEFVLSTTLSESKKYSLHMRDESGRQGAFPPELKVEAIKNSRPDFRFEIPRGDQRLSAIEEVLFKGEVSDDFGLRDYGIGLVIHGGEAEYMSLAGDAFAGGSLLESVEHRLDLEEYELRPRETLSWYLWADDLGPNGELRRSTSSLYFGDIRSFDEIFREQDQGGGPQGGESQGGQEGLELLEKQKRIAISLFGIKNNDTNIDSTLEDIDVIQRTQVEALQELQQLIPMMQQAESLEYAKSAQRYMEGVDVGLSNAIDLPSFDPLDLAWSDAHNAYNQLLKLTEDEFNVSRGSSSGGSGSGSSRNQAQINELDFRQEDSRYETASEAQKLTSPEDRKNLELISKLNELARRQDDLNERLQEMQSDLASARTQEERDRIQRELKRLQDEQRQMLADADEAMQQPGASQQSQQAREQLEEARENMRQAGQQLEDGEVSQALASGTRAQDTLRQTSEKLREENSSEFSDAMREARRQARELAESQRQLEQEVGDLNRNAQRKLDDNAERDQLSEKIEAQSQNVETLLNEIREVAENSENVEPGLFRELYQVLRDSNGSQFDERFENSARLLRQGFVNESSEEQAGLSEDLQSLSESIEDAAETILGSEGATLEFAQSEIDSLREQLDQEQNRSPSRQNSSSEGAGSSGGERSPLEQIREAIEGYSQPANGPITGGDFSGWIERLSTVESLVDEPLARARLSEIRESAEEMRRDFKRHGEVPKWDIILEEVGVPLNEVGSWLASELQRIENPDALQAIDRDPIPEEYDHIVRSYYEALGSE